jgi:hypothetical protein
MMAEPSLYIIFLEPLRTIAFLILQMPQTAGWLWKKTQADTKNRKDFDPLIKQSRHK